MLGIDARAARASWTVLLVALAALTLYKIRGTLLIFTIALLLAYLLAPLVDLLDRLTPRKFPRTLSLAVVYVVLIAVAAAIGASVGSQIVRETALLASKAPEWLQSADIEQIHVPAWMEPWRQQAIEALRAQLESGVKEAVPLVQSIGQHVLSALGQIGFLILVPILSFLFLKDAANARARILGQLGEGPRRALLEDILSDVHVLLGQFMRALVILAAATFVFYGLFFWMIGVPYAALLAGLAGALEFIPVIGPLSAGIVIVLVALLSGSFSLALWVLGFLLVYRMFQDYVLQPYLMSAGVELHPAWVMFGVLAGQQLAGAAGMFLSIPVLATLRVVYVRIRKSRERERAVFEKP